jgi:hypothetical protein
MLVPMRPPEMPRLAFYTYGLLRAPLGHPQMRDFETVGASVFARARTAPGFLHLVESPQTAYPRFRGAADHPADTLSVWASLEAVFAFAYGGLHAEALKQRKAWFRPQTQPLYAAWWLPEQHLPDWAEAVVRYERLADRGATPFAFDFRTPFSPSGERLPPVRPRA